MLSWMKIVERVTSLNSGAWFLQVTFKDGEDDIFWEQFPGESCQLFIVSFCERLCNTVLLLILSRCEGFPHVHFSSKRQGWVLSTFYWKSSTKPLNLQKRSSFSGSSCGWMGIPLNSLWGKHVSCDKLYFLVCFCFHTHGTVSDWHSVLMTTQSTSIRWDGEKNSSNSVAEKHQTLPSAFKVCKLSFVPNNSKQNPFILFKIFSQTFPKQQYKH